MQLSATQTIFFKFLMLTSSNYQHERQVYNSTYISWQISGMQM